MPVPDELIITYSDAEGHVRERRITNITVTSWAAFDAFCHLRGEGRTFRFDGVLEAIIPRTGEVVADLRELLGVRPSDIPARHQISMALRPILKAILELHQFAADVRGLPLRKRERDEIANFICARASLPPELLRELDNWIGALAWRADDERNRPAPPISATLRRDCRQVALQIAHGSGRKPIAPEVMARIESDFGSGTAQ